MKIQQEVGLHESLAPLHQVRKVVLVALFVDQSGRCLIVRGGLHQEEHQCLGAHKCALPFAERVIRSVPGLNRCRPRGVARTYDHELEGVSPVTFVVVRVDVGETPVVPDGEWVSSVERAIELTAGDLIAVRCIQQHLGDSLAWQLPQERQS